MMLKAFAISEIPAAMDLGLNYENQGLMNRTAAFVVLV
jgi:hypothetical protein